jgi:hypothetical protein
MHLEVAKHVSHTFRERNMEKRGRRGRRRGRRRRRLVESERHEPRIRSSVFKERVVEVKDMSEEEEKIVKVGWASLSRSEKSLSINVLNQQFFVPLRDLDLVLNGDRKWVDIMQWVAQRKEEGEESSDSEEEWEEWGDSEEGEGDNWQEGRWNNGEEEER